MEQRLKHDRYVHRGTLSQDGANQRICPSAFWTSARFARAFPESQILKNIDFSVRPQELVFIIGPSGSGKSTFLRCLNRLESRTAAPSGSTAWIC